MSDNKQNLVEDELEKVSGGDSSSMFGTLDACPCCGGSLSSEYFVAPFYWCSSEVKAFRVMNGQIHYCPSITKNGNGWRISMSVKDQIIG